MVLRAKVTLIQDDITLMAAAPYQPVPKRETYERLSSLYLTLWKQLDLVTDEGKWLQIRPAQAGELKARVEAIVKEIQVQLRSHGSTGELVSNDIVCKDVKKTQEFSEGATEIEGTKRDVFRDYLRDHALRYSQLASGQP